MDSETFLKVFDYRVEQLRKDMPYLTVEQARERYKALWNCCPIELHIDHFGILKELENQFPNFHIEGVTRKTYTINIGGTKPNWLTMKLLDMEPHNIVLSAFALSLLLMLLTTALIALVSP